ncbi:MAG: type II CRISPR RNA-guided endonuclease Cas9 [Lachnospiraceae bacterium]|nr:type II CRISPR RNA-guided endonuclease Cas9 [Lachnospiraceae bacterium]
MEKNKKEEYYLGLDIGTGSIGWAVTDKNYEIIKKHGKALWGIRLFESANTAEERRNFRSARRRTERNKNRIALLQEIFAEEISKKDPGFFQRMKESRYYPEDKRDQNGNALELPYALFADIGFTDADFYKKFPTIYHLRYALIKQPEAKPDIRLIYLAIHHIIKHRGHFLFEGKKMSEVTDFSNAVQILAECAEANNIILSLDDNKIQSMEEILKRRDKNRTEKKKQLCDLIADNDKQKKALAGLLAGCQIKLSELFADKSLEEEEQNKLSFSDSKYEDNISQIESFLADRFLLMVAAKAIYDWSVLSDILGTATYLSEAKMEIYNKHKLDLDKLKNLLKTDSSVYHRVFGIPETEKETNYSAYIGMVKKNGKKQSIKNCPNKEEFYSFLRKILNNFSCPEEDKQIVDELLAEIDNGTLFPKQSIRDNGVIPYQLHERELIKILENAASYYPFLMNKDSNGYTQIEKIRSIFRFRIPYYVGPINTYHQDQGGNSWAVRKDALGKVYPWNFTEKIDEELSAEKFIRRMTNKCTYLIGEDVLPKESLLYAKFCVLNELNNLRIDGELAPVWVKQKIYTDVFQYNRNVTGKKLKNYMIKEGIITKEQELSGFDQNFKSSLKAYHDIKQIAGEIPLSKIEQEDIIKDITLFADSQKMLKRRLKQKYPILSDKQISQLAEKKYKGWGRLSRTFLEDLESVNVETGELYNIITALWETNDNLMQLLSKKYQFSDEIEKRNSQFTSKSEITYEDIQELYVSPAVKRPIWQTFKIVRELEQIMGCAPVRIFVEMAREPGQKGERKISRKAKLQDLYRNCKKEAPELYNTLSQKNDNELRSDKLYLYYTQMGRCMYSNEVIDLEDLFTNRYDIDHIYPQSKVMDDSLDNRVLVKRELNSNKTDVFPVPIDYVNTSKGLWTALLQKNLITKEKYHRLTRREPLNEGELAGFIARQLVETRQSTKAVTQLLKKNYPDTEIIYAKAKAISNFRLKFDLIKVRDINDYHHAKDAYLNIVVGNAYYVKFTKDAAWFVKNNPGRTYNLKKMFEQDTIKRGSEVAWVPGENGTITTIKKWMHKNNILFTRKSYNGKGKLFDQQLLKKGKGQVPIKTEKRDTRLTSIEKYGGYNSASGAYFILVESEDKKGNLIQSIKHVPIYLSKKLESSPEYMLQYCRDEFGLKNPKILLANIKIDTLLDIDGFQAHLSGRSGKQLILKNANQFVIQNNIAAAIKKVIQFCTDYKINKNAVISDKMDLSEEDLQNIYQEFQHKLENTIYGKHLTEQIKTLKNGKEKFKLLTKEEKCLVLYEILHLFQCQSTTANLSLIGGPKSAGIIRLNNNISKLNHICIIHQSITGFYEQVIDLKAL